MVVVGLTLAGSAHAMPEFWRTFADHYKVKSGAIFEASCQTCHTQPPVHNAYGKAVFAEMKKEHVDVLNGAVLGAIESQDSDGDGWSNADEIKQGFLPGDPASHPSGKPPRTVTQPKSVPAASEASSLLPEHMFHPLIVHFPIALFLFGVFLEVIGLRRKDDSLRRFALWNIGFAALSSLGAVTTGFLFFLNKGFPFSGLPLYHLISGASACVFMSLATLMKRRDPLAHGAYWAVILLATVATALAGYLGGTLVFG